MNRAAVFITDDDHCDVSSVSVQFKMAVILSSSQIKASIYDFIKYSSKADNTAIRWFEDYVLWLRRYYQRTYVMIQISLVNILQA